MKKIAFLFPAIAAVLLVGSPAAKAANLQLSAVTPLDTFTFDLVYVTYNTTSGAVIGASFLATGSGTFGLTTTTTTTPATFGGVTPASQTVTVSSSEALGVTNTTDTFTISTPTNFLLNSTNDASGNVINGLQFEVGDSNSGGNPVALFLPISSYTDAGSVLFAGSNTPFSIPPLTMLAGNGSSYAFVEAIKSSVLTTPVSNGAFRNFTYSITYPNAVPEPTSLAMLGFGVVAGAAMIRRRLLA